METKKIIEKIKETKKLVLWKDKVDKPLARLIKKKKGEDSINKIRNEKEEVTMDTAKL